MSTKELLEDNPQPAQAAIPVKCRDCLHFKDVPYYKIGGSATVCSHENIGRREGDVPCPNFAVNMNYFKHLTPEVIHDLHALLNKLGLSAEPKTRAAQHRDARSLEQFALTLLAMAHARRTGYSLGGTYTVTGRAVEGILVGLGRTHATVRRTDNHVPYTVPRETIVRA